MLELDFRPNPLLLVCDSLFDPIDHALLQVLQLRFVLVPRLFQQLGESALLRLLIFDRFPQLGCFILHLNLVRAFLDVRVVRFLVLSGFVVHLL